MRWSYKTINYELKKEGILGSAFLDESEIELSLNQYGMAGWELISLLETMDGLIAVFKRPINLDIGVVSAAPAAPAPERSEPPPIRAVEEPKTDVTGLRKKNEPVIKAEDTVESTLLDELFEVVEKDEPEPQKAKPPVEPVNIGMIRIE